MTDKKKIEWLKKELYKLKDYVNENKNETVEEVDIDTCLWCILNGYELFDTSKKVVEL